MEVALVFIQAVVGSFSGDRISPGCHWKYGKIGRSERSAVVSPGAS